jgi:26S proteasome regulatory subunit N1
MLGRQQICLELEDTEVGDSEELTEIMSNNHLNHHFLNLAREVILQLQFSICFDQLKP